MSKVAILTDTNSGITPAIGEDLGVRVVPMPFYIDGELYFEGVNLTQEEFYHKLENDAQISTSMPAIGDLMDMWDDILKTYDQIVYIPMSSGLSSSCMTATALAEENYEGKVFVANNQRISVTQRESVLHAKYLADQGWDAEAIKNKLEEVKFDSSIYITVDTLKYLKKGGRITPSAAALGTLLRIKPVLQIQGEKLDSFAKCRTMKHARSTMIAAIEKDRTERFRIGKEPGECLVAGAYTCGPEEAAAWKAELESLYPGHEIVLEPLPLSIACHIGPGSQACTMGKHYKNYEV